MAVERKNMTEEAHVALAATLGNAQYDIQSKTIWRYKELRANSSYPSNDSRGI